MSRLPFYDRLAGLTAATARDLFRTATGLMQGWRGPAGRPDVLTQETVAKVPFFATLDPAAIADVAGTLRRIDVPRHSMLIRKGDVGDCMYFIADGEVEIELPADKRIHLGTGAFFGEMALVDDRPRSANVFTTRTSTLLVLDLADFRVLMARHPDLASIVNAEAKRRAQQNA
ncbi:MAG: cyclic nucleotide-binding domain-containing protein [Pseudomonadota bacterium]